MVDSKEKGARGENLAKELLNKYTNMKWERIPLSGSLDAKHGLKGDLYVPGKSLIFCVEVKSYKDDHVSTKLLTSKESQVEAWWSQARRQAQEVGKEPLLLFKHDRSKLFVCTEYEPEYCEYLYISKLKAYVAVAESWLQKEDLIWE